MKSRDWVLPLAGAFIFMFGFAIGVSRTVAQAQDYTVGSGNWATCNDCAVTITNSKARIIIRQDGIVRDGDNRDLAELPLTEQVVKLCAALEGVSHVKFTKCGGAP